MEATAVSNICVDPSYLSDKGRTSLGAKPNQGFPESELGTTLTLKAYPTFSKIYPSSWTLEQIESFCDSLKSAVASATRGKDKVVYATCHDRDSGVRTLVVLLVPLTVLKAQDKNYIARQLEPYLDRGSAWDVFPMEVSGVKQADSIHQVEVVRRMLKERFLGITV